MRLHDAGPKATTTGEATMSGSNPMDSPIVTSDPAHTAETRIQSKPHDSAI